MNIELLYQMEMIRKRRIGTGYRKKDLVLHLDAIDNTPDGHSNNTTTWYDLAGNMNVTLYNATWGANYCAFNDTVYGIGAAWTFSIGNTIEIVIKRTGNFYSLHGSVILSFNYVGGSGLRLILQPQRNQTLAYFVGESVSIGSGLNNNVITYFGVSHGVARQNATMYTPSIVSGIGTTSAKMIIGAQWSSVDQNLVRSDLSFRGNIYAVRVYDANLTANELYAHWLIDKKRFNIPD